MKSPFEHMPDLIPVPPRRDVRLTLTPDQVITLYTVIQDAIDSDNTTGRVREVLEGIDEQLSDKLDFKALQGD